MLHELGWEVDESGTSRQRLVYAYVTDVDLSAIDPARAAATVPAALRAEAADLWRDAVEPLAGSSGVSAAGIRASHGLGTYEFRYRRVRGTWRALEGRYGVERARPG